MKLLWGVMVALGGAGALVLLGVGYPATGADLTVAAACDAVATLDSERTADVEPCTALDVNCLGGGGDGRVLDRVFRYPVTGNSTEPWRLADCLPLLKQHGIMLGGHLQQGATTNSRNPKNPPRGFGNRPATLFNYRNDEYMFNQVLLTVERNVERLGRGWELGGRIDLVYGMDYVFLQSRGLETRGDFSSKWNSGRGGGWDGQGMMGLALPQTYLEVAYNDFSVKLGHFYHPMGYERPIPTENYLYSTNYGFPFGRQAFMIVGMQAGWHVGDGWCLLGGFHRGMVNWEDNNDQLNGFGGLIWNSADKKTVVSYYFDIGDEGETETQTTFLQVFIFERQVGQHVSYIFHANYGRGYPLGPVRRPGESGDWYGVTQGVAYKINRQWTVGVRYEWFDDIDGVAVRVPEPPQGPGVYHNVTLGANYHATANLTFRPEVRWDWFDPRQPGSGRPFGDRTRRDQFMAAMDVILTF